MNHLESGPDTPGRTILVIDDSSDVLTLCNAILRHAGFNPRVASCGADGVALFQAEEIDLVVLDMGLPDMDGSEVLAALRAHRRDAKVLISSGYDRQKLTEIDSDDVVGFLRKPWSIRDLLSMIDQTLSAQGRPSGSPQDSSSSTGA